MLHRGLWGGFHPRKSCRSGYSSRRSEGARLRHTTNTSGQVDNCSPPGEAGVSPFRMIRPEKGDDRLCGICRSPLLHTRHHIQCIVLLQVRQYGAGRATIA